ELALIEGATDGPAPVDRLPDPRVQAAKERAGGGGLLHPRIRNGCAARRCQRMQAMRRSDLSRAVEAPVLDRFGEMRRRDVVFAREIRDRPRDAKDARVGAGGEPEPVARRFEEAPPRHADAADAADLTAGGGGVERE